MFKVIKTSDVLRRMQEQDLSEFVSKVKAFEMKLLKLLKSCVLSDSKDASSPTPADNGKLTAASSQKKGNSQESEGENNRVRERTINTAKRSR